LFYSDVLFCGIVEKGLFPGNNNIDKSENNMLTYWKRWHKNFEEFKGNVISN